jgi:hypothetical protein
MLMLTAKSCGPDAPAQTMFNVRKSLVALMPLRLARSCLCMLPCSSGYNRLFLPEIAGIRG